MKPARAKKSLGQNFLISKEIVSKIIDAISPLAGETIVEIGPGRGELTMPLAESGADIVAVELDSQLCRLLHRTFENNKNVTILERDILDFIPAEYDLKSFTLCGNLPFNITSPVIDWIVHHRSVIKKAVIMIQKEVAQRLASKPGGKDWSPLAIMTQLYFKINILFNVPPHHFKPSPKVTSAVVQLIPKEEVTVDHFDQFEQLVRSSFKQRRKQLINNLVPNIIPTVEAAERILNQLGFGRNVRAEEIDTEEFLELTELLIEHNMLEIKSS